MTPRLLVLTDRAAAAAAGRTVPAAVDEALDGGAPVIVLRERDLARAERAALATRLRRATTAAGAQLWLGGDPELAAEVGADGVHLPAWAPVVRARGVAVTGRSCHDRAEVTGAATAGLDHVTCSPVAPTPTKPGYGPALGPDGLRALVSAAGSLPVFALGGVRVEDVGVWRRAGAHGVAVLGAVMGADEPAESTAALLAAVHAPSSPTLHDP